MKELNGMTALITGGSKGIGYGIAEMLLKEGVNVAITSRHQDAADAAARELSKTGPGKVIGIAADVRDFESQKNAVAKTLETFGQLDVLVANAGVGHFAPITEMTPEQWHETIDTNLTGVFFSLKAAVDALIDSKGYFISIASLAGTNFFPTASAYNASKFGLVGFTQAAMLDLRDAGIKCTTIMPGSVATHFNNHEPKAEEDAWKIQPEDLGQMVVDLLRMNPRTLPSKIEVRPSQTPKK
jgi:3-oxoacyl-[acyl-carrier protein] reductase